VVGITHPIPLKLDTLLQDTGIQRSSTPPKPSSYLAALVIKPTINTVITTMDMAEAEPIVEAAAEADTVTTDPGAESTGTLASNPTSQQLRSSMLKIWTPSVLVCRNL
jgi:hypothetical protein